MSKIATRKSFGQALVKLAAFNRQIVCLDADLSKSTQSCLFAEAYPDRFFDMGIQEANMIGVAAGMAFAGKIPFICSFACFLTSRFDQIRMSIGYSQANVKIVGTHAGLGVGGDGHSQMGLEDIALMRTIPNMTILQPAGDREAQEMVAWAIEHAGPVYLRLTRQDVESDDKFPFTPGLWPELVSGEQVAFLAAGAMVPNALQACNLLAQEGLQVGVINANCPHPLPHDCLQKIVQKYQTLVVVEDHSVIGGTGEAVAAWTATHHPCRVYRWGVEGFGESGDPKALYAKHRLTADALALRLRQEVLAK